MPLPSADIHLTLSSPLEINTELISSHRTEGLSFQIPGNEHSCTAWILLPLLLLTNSDLSTSLAKLTMSCHLCQDIAHDISPLHSGLSDGTFAPFLSSNDPPSDAAFSRITNDILPLLSSHIEHVKSHTSKGSSDELAALETLLENYKLIVSRTDFSPRRFSGKSSTLALNLELNR
ncbi:hypothetical protein CPB85DRAFT_1454063 [Mucidula mucida]|nr:hypothetical protein CPB85DRAFT_1454063 [Mucidula mucida]